MSKRRLSLAAMCFLLAGCHHRRTAVRPPTQAQAPVPLAAPPEPAKPPVVEPQPVPPLPPVALKPPRTPAKKPAPKPPKPAVPVETASAAPPAGVAALGSLSTGEDASPARRQQAMDLLAVLDKRLKAVPEALAQKHEKQIAQVKNFVRQSKLALDSGDPDGAINLATKARLLLDDLGK
jgi:hypothetical protein